ncbi:MAG: bifunctional orotidine-5'-phosphate decarboxylase/orotate phosphoribosyltransferase [Synechocystis sp.]|nr:bifunctional orotidine-5'-phosphate decarboxylase/orotate phosphoribosyltransferase [Synechocystis sp.]
MSFFTKLQNAVFTNQSRLVAPLDPNPEMLPPVTAGPLIDHFAACLGEIIRQTQSQVCAYKPAWGFYDVLGAPGLELWDWLLRQIPPEIPVILDAKQGDLNTSTVFARKIFEAWNVDAVTLVPYAGQDHSAPFLVYGDRGVFLLCHTSNPGAQALQNFPVVDNPFYLQVVREVQSWAPAEQLFLEVGVQDPEVLRRIRALAPERTILLRSVWGDGTDLGKLLQSGVNAQGEGILIPVPQDYCLTLDDLNPRLQRLNQQVNQLMAIALTPSAPAPLWTPDLCFLNPHPHQDLILELFDLGCLLFGEYVQASGATFNYYIDLRRIISNPQLFQDVLRAYGMLLETLEFERIAGIPYGSLPTATGLSLLLHKPMIYPRKEVKAHGTRRLIEGHYEPGERVVVVDDILITGKSALEGVAKLESAGLTVQDIVVLIDHGDGVNQRIQAQGYRPHAVLAIGEITETLYGAGRLTEEQYATLT